MVSILTTLYLALNGLLYTGLGVAYLVSPHKMASKTDFVLSSGTAEVELRAIYGGLEIALGLFMIFCAFRPSWLVFGLVLTVVIYAGFAGGRIMGIILADSFGGITWKLLLFEVAAVLLGSALLVSLMLNSGAGK